MECEEARGAEIALIDDREMLRHKTSTDSAPRPTTPGDRLCPRRQPVTVSSDQAHPQRSFSQPGRKPYPLPDSNGNNGWGSQPRFQPIPGT
jgi:hypothetical protein